MREVLRVYFGHKSVIVYYAILILLGAYLLTEKIFHSFWFVGLALFVTPVFEWLVHKYFLHIKFNFKSKILKEYFYKIHEGHHEHPDDKELVFAPLLIGLSVPIIFFTLCYVATMDIKPSLMLAFYTLAYYAYYEWVHLAHHTEQYVPLTKRGRMLKKHHIFHHFKKMRIIGGA